MSAQLLLLLYCQLHYNPTHEASYWNRRNGLTGIIFVTIPNMKPGTEIDETDWRASLTLQSHTWSQVPKSTKRTDGHNLRYNPTHEARYRNRRNGLTGIIYVTIPHMKPGTEIDETDWRASFTLQSQTWSQVPKSRKRTDGHNLRYNPTHEARYRNRRNRMTGIIYVTIPHMKPGTEISLHQRNSLHTTDQPHKASHAKAACHQSDHLLIISLLILLVCVSWTIIGQPQNSVFNLFICRVQPE